MELTIGIICIVLLMFAVYSIYKGKSETKPRYIGQTLAEMRQKTPPSSHVAPAQQLDKAPPTPKKQTEKKIEGLEGGVDKHFDVGITARTALSMKMSKFPEMFKDSTPESLDGLREVYEDRLRNILDRMIREGRRDRNMMEMNALDEL